MTCLAGSVTPAAARRGILIRLILAALGLLACTAGAVVFLVVVSQPVIAAVWAFFAATAVADMAVVARRKLRSEPVNRLLRHDHDRVTTASGRES
jgi:uncharacterized protein DUF6343